MTNTTDPGAPTSDTLHGDIIVAAARLVRDDIWTAHRVLDPTDMPTLSSWGLAARPEDYRALAGYLPNKADWDAVAAARRVIDACAQPHTDEQLRRSLAILDSARDVTLRVEDSRTPITPTA